MESPYIASVWILPNQTLKYVLVKVDKSSEILSIVFQETTATIFQTPWVLFDRLK